MTLRSAAARQRCLGFCLAAALLAPAAPNAGETVLIDQADLVEVPEQGIWAAHIRLNPPDPALPVVAPSLQAPAATLLRRLAARGRAVGLGGVLYDNRDRGHSVLPPDLFPQLARVEYAPALREAGRDYGLAGELLFPAIVLGNSSTALTSGPAARSLPRFAMTTPGLPARIFAGYSANALYVYPEHRDHDDRDLFPANWPYTVTTQGSSGSDRPFLAALAMSLAAFRPETRELMQTEGLVAPTLQMILRRSLRPVTSRAAYLSGIAHPTAFVGADLVPGRMVTLAAALTPGTVPPMVRIHVVDEDFAAADTPGGLSERLYDTPSAVARIWRGPQWQKHLTVSAARTFDPNGRQLSFTWALLRGDPAGVQIEPFGTDAAQARIRLNWQDPAAGGPPGAPPGSRIDIGVFASNGVHDSAPAILSVLLPLHEGRVYAPGPGGKMSLTATERRSDVPRDRILFPPGTGR